MMKCDELQQVENPIEWGLYYDKNEVDAAIAELKDDKASLEKDVAYWRKEYDEETKLTEALKDDVAELKAMVTTDNSAVIARLEDDLRKTQRALWLARAYIMTLLQRDFQRLAYQCNSTDTKKRLLEKRNRFYDISENFNAKAKEYE